MSGSLKKPWHDESGATLMELLVVVVVIAVVAGFALMRRGSANQQLTRQNAAQSLKVAFERARFDSVKRRAVGSSQEAFVTVTPTSYTLRTYSNDVNGNPVARDKVTNLPTGVVIALYGGGSLTSQEIRFNQRGEVPVSPSPQFYVCNDSCSSPTNANANIVIVTPTGTVSFLPGGASLPTFGVPSITAIPSNTGVVNDAVMP